MNVFLYLLKIYWPKIFWSDVWVENFFYQFFQLIQSSMFQCLSLYECSCMCVRLEWIVIPLEWYDQWISWTRSICRTGPHSRMLPRAKEWDDDAIKCGRGHAPSSTLFSLYSCSNSYLTLSRTRIHRVKYLFNPLSTPQMYCHFYTWLHEKRRTSPSITVIQICMPHELNPSL